MVSSWARVSACSRRLSARVTWPADRLAIAAYLGAGARFDQAIARFSAAYADQNERDYQRLLDAVAAGEITAQFGV